MIFFDSHSHLNFSDYDKDRREVIRRSLAAGVFMLNVGANYQSSKRVVDIAGKHEQGVYAAIGLHPSNITQKSKLKSQNHNLKLKIEKPEDILERDFDYEKYKKLAESSKKVVAIGEIGFDFLNLPKDNREEFKNKQKEILLKQMELARELALPVIFHCRKAHNDLIQELGIKNKELGTKGIIHCFTGDWSQAQKYLDLGLHLGFNGIIYKLNLRETIEKCPLDRMLLETDCPFLAPPMFGAKRNEPIAVKQIAETMAETRGEPLWKIIEAVAENGKALFGLPNK